MRTMKWGSTIINIGDIISKVKDANPTRNLGNIQRRCMKLIEEAGETAEAFLGITSSIQNAKGKTWDDVREETADMLIVAIDIALTISETFPTYYVEKEHPFHISNAMMMKYLADFMLEYQYTGMEGWARLYKDCTDVIQAAVELSHFDWPDQKHLSVEEKDTNLRIEIDRKLAKWASNRAKMAVVTDDV